MNPASGYDNPYNQFDFPVQLSEYQNLPSPEASYFIGTSYPLPAVQDAQYRAFGSHNEIRSDNEIRAEDAEKREEPGTIDPALLAAAVAFAAPVDASESTPPAEEWTPAPTYEDTLLCVGKLDYEIAADAIADALGAAVTLGPTHGMSNADEDTVLPFQDARDHLDNQIDDDAVADVQGAAVTLPTHGMSKAAAKEASKEVDPGDDERFSCPVDGCTQTFVVRSTLERHLWAAAVPCVNNCGKLIKRGNDESTMRRHIERWCKNTPKETRKKNIASARDKALWEKRKRAAAATPSPPPERPTKRKRAHSV